MGSIFSSASVLIASRLESLKEAETALVHFAVTRYHDCEDRMSKDPESPTHTIELFDTPISYENIPLDRSRKTCQIQGHDSERLLDRDSFLIHGIKVISNLCDKRAEKDVEVKKDPPLVLLHGYMNGSLYFYRNLLGLSNRYSGGVYAFDLLGWGLSSRPPFKPKAIAGKKYDDDTHVAEQIFVESIEEWRKAQKIEKLTLGGHSMGAYIATAYVEKYPENVDRLILISPAGVPDDKDYDMDNLTKDAPLRFRILFGLANFLWNKDVTPASIIRNMPEDRSHNMVKKYVERRLPTIICSEERSHLARYLFMNSKLPGSGEYFLNKFLKPTSFALKPLMYRIPKLSVKSVSIIYGQYDWMDPIGGIRTKEICDQLKIDGHDNVPDVNVWGVSNAGHLLMLENWGEFNNAMFAATGKNMSSKHTLPYKLEDGKYSSSFFRADGFQKRIKKETPPDFEE